MLTCNPENIDAFLADQLSEAEQNAFEQHLDECDSCCAELQQRTADVRLWDDARSYLSSTEFNSDSAEPQADTAGFDLQNLDFLAPTDDPHMLGRFAGYEISAVIGCGGMGVVLKAFDSALNRYSAIKVLAPHYASSGAARQRFAREAQAAAAVVHDNVIAIHGVDEFNGLPYLAMPYVKGESLQKRIARDGALSIEEVLRIAMQAARGLAAAHDQGLVHRDIKPGNILLPENVERVVITDFGLARAADDASLTRSGVIAGTPQYMSPEQARGEGIDHRSDLFSLGSVMYAMCTGHPPFRAETPYGILRRITDNEPRPIRELNPAAPEWLCGFVNRLLSKQPADRFGTAIEVADLLEDCLAHVQQPTKVSLPDVVRASNRRDSIYRRILWRLPIFLMLMGVWWYVNKSPFPPVHEVVTESTVGVSEVEATTVRAEPSASRQDSPAEHATNENEPPEAAAVRSAQPSLPVTGEDLDWFEGDSEINDLESTLYELNQELEM